MQCDVGNNTAIGYEDGIADPGALGLLAQAITVLPASYANACARFTMRAPVLGWKRKPLRERLLCRGIVLPSWARLRLAVKRYRAYGLPTPIDGIELPPPVPRPSCQRAYVAGKVLELDAPYHPPPIPRGSRARGLRGPGGRGLPLPPKDRRVAVEVAGKLVQCSTRLPRWLEEADRPWVANAREALEAVKPKPVQPMQLRFASVAPPAEDHREEWQRLLESGRRSRGGV
jgi:hypothetical protein